MLNFIKILFYYCLFILLFHFMWGGRFFDTIYKLLYKSNLKETNEVLHYHTEKYNTVLNEIVEATKRLETIVAPEIEPHDDKPYSKEERDVMKRDLISIVQSFQSIPPPTPMAPQMPPPFPR